MWADRALEWLGAVGLGQNRQSWPCAAKRDGLVDQQVVAAVDDEGTGREPYDLAGGAGIDGGLNARGVILHSPTRSQCGADPGSNWDAAHAIHPWVPNGGPLVWKQRT